MRLLLAAAWSWVLLVPARAGEIFPEGPAGETAAAFFEAWNRGERKGFETFEESFRSDAALAEKPAAERAGQYEKLFARIGAVEARKATELGEWRLLIGGPSERMGWVSFEFELEAEDPHKLLSVSIAIGDPPPKEPAPEAGSRSAEEIASELDELLTRMERLGFSGGVAVVLGETPVLEKGYGLADRESGTPVTADTVFTCGSITKQFTGAAIMTLVMAGELSLEDPIGEHFEGVPPDKAGITIHQLLTHSSGIGDGFAGDFDERATRDWFLAQVLSSPLLWAPGERYRYSNAGYSLLGMIVEDVSGQSYEEYLRESLFEPAGMHRSGYLLPEFAPDDLAVGYRGGERWGTVIGRPMADDGPFWALRANGGIHTTVGDMARWHAALRGAAVLSEEAKKAYFAPHVDEGGGASHYGYGWVNQATLRGTRMLWHDGGNGIFMAECRRYVDEDAMIYLASNADVKAGHLMDTLDAILFGHEYTRPPEVVRVEPALLQRYQGTYALPSGATVSVAAASGHLLLAGRGEQAVDLLAGGDGTVDPDARELIERTLGITGDCIDGNTEALLEASSAGLRERGVEDMVRSEIAMWEEEAGALVDFSWASTANEGNATCIALRMEHERRSWYALYYWRGGELVGIGADEVPPGGGTPSGGVAFYPESPSSFLSFDLRSPVSVRVELEPEGRHVTFRTGAGEVRAERR